MLDINNEGWLKQDIGPLYNAWVMQKSWKKESFELEDNMELTKDRSARMLYKASLGIPLSIVELTANWIIPAGGSFNDGNFVPDIEASTFSVGVLLNLF